ncbi:MAG: hypothetical protein EOO64_05970 [Massilia sp.]|nr:MAG: hypothetical protein EOO64_05970 [Massilia sp.]
MTTLSLSGARRAPRITAPLVIAGLIANLVIAHLAYGEKARVFFGRQDWMADFVKHVMSFPGTPLAQSIFPGFIGALQHEIEEYSGKFGHFHNMPETVLLTLGIRPLFGLFDPFAIYGVIAILFTATWCFFVLRYAEPESRPLALGLAIFNYPFLFMLERGNMFAGITAVCILVMLCRRKLDWGAVILMAVAANIRPNVAVLVLPLLAWDRQSLIFLVRTAAVGAGLGLACLAIDGMIYPAYDVSSLLRGLLLYKMGYVLGPLGQEFVSSLWGALRHVLPNTDGMVTLLTVIGLIPLVFAWFARDRLSYPAACFLVIAGCMLSTAVLSDYHLVIFVVPLLLLQRDDPAFWPILLGVCWLLIPKNYNASDVLSWQIYLNPAGMVLASLATAWAYRAKMSPRSDPGPVAAQS